MANKINKLEFRLATIEDLEQIMIIIKQAQAYLLNNNIDQWQNNYPNKETIFDDIKNKNSYVLIKNDKIIATAAIIFTKDKTYNNIYEGNWISNKAYSTIHRIAISDNHKELGVGSRMITEAIKLSRNKKTFSIRIDTHKDNIVMQKFLLKNDFKYCGIIYLEDKNKRLAFEKIIS